MIKNKYKSETKRKRELITAIVMLLIALLLIFLDMHSCNAGKDGIPSNEPLFLEDEGFSARGEAEVRTT